MDPHWLFPLLSAGFALAAVLRWVRHRRWHGTAATWALMSLLFGAVSLWLWFGPPQ